MALLWLAEMEPARCHRQFAARAPFIRLRQRGKALPRFVRRTETQGVAKFRWCLRRTAPFAYRERRLRLGVLRTSVGPAGDRRAQQEPERDGVAHVRRLRQPVSEVLRRGGLSWMPLAHNL